MKLLANKTPTTFFKRLLISKIYVPFQLSIFILNFEIEN